ncbi:hypothetical protein DW228_03325 [Bacteroides fragilis]|uniref:Uncharacterized protein n=4 Tax=Bacteroides TaxID=816 RepID=A0A2K9GY40_BACFG|nr:hypothetical protein BUN20_09220 [Bacteroides fragilis]QLK83831.1 hypothetical protein DBK98_017645 [Bacteroides sp. PHL 2737]QCQ33202.1 hypothetical protein IB64_017035 [Bacteroides fragilis]QCQ37676.1 hypothetical protein IA74_017085 [Bacteroides fragilis]QCQ46451.1 hypothetical protein EC80_017185 [Bacteroides fragilis]
MFGSLLTTIFVPYSHIKKIKQMKKIILGACAVLFTLASCQQAKQKVFELASEQVNKQCPITVDEMTRMDSTTYSGKDNTFTYFYTLSGQADDPTMSEQLKKSLEETLPETIKNTEEMKVYRESDVTIKYIYLSGKTQEELMQVTVTPEMYK